MKIKTKGMIFVECGLEELSQAINQLVEQGYYVKEVDVNTIELYSIAGKAVSSSYKIIGEEVAEHE